MLEGDCRAARKREAAYAKRYDNKDFTGSKEAVRGTLYNCI